MIAKSPHSLFHKINRCLLPVALLAFPLTACSKTVSEIESGFIADGVASPPTPLNARFLPKGAQAEGTMVLVDLDPIYEFRYEGDETLVYRIDTSDANLQKGLLRVEETTLGVWPITQAGFSFRTSGGNIISPVQLAEGATVEFSKHVLGDSLVLQYRETYFGNHAKTYEIRGVGKALELHVFDANESTHALGNYAGFEFGPVEGADTPYDLRIPFMISTPVTRFSANDGNGAFVATQTDWSRSNSTVPAWPFLESVKTTASTIDRGAALEYAVNTAGSLNAPLDETIWILATRDLEATFPETEAIPSPYRKSLVGRTVGLFSRRTPWDEQKQLVDLLDTWGMEHMAMYDFYWWSATLWPFAGQEQTHQWTPAHNEFDFIPYSTHYRDLGYLFGCYTLYGSNPSQPMFTETDGIIDWSRTRLVRISPDRVITHSLREDTVMRTRYQTSMSFTDVWGMEHPAVVADHEVGQLDKAKTCSEALAAKRKVYRQMQEIHQGPCLSEGSGANNGVHRQFELLSAGFVDSTQSSINTGAGVDLQELTSNHPLTPENWWVMPDYALRVINRLQVNHGNGFYDRFFFNSQTPFPEGDLDHYRITEITYGHSSFFQTTGPINGTEVGEPNNRIFFADHIKEYYLMQALQREYLSSKVGEISYWKDGVFLDAEAILRTSNHPEGPMEEFRNPQIRIRYANGLELHLNHASTNWAISSHGRDYILPENGWVGSNSNTGLLAFSAIPDHPKASTPGIRIDYCKAPNWYELLDGRGAINEFDGTWNPNPEKLLYVRNHVRELTIEEGVRRRILVDQGIRPNITSLQLDGPNSYGVGDRAKLSPTATYSNGSSCEYSYLLGQWLSSQPLVAKVNSAGVVTGLSAGFSTITFKSQDGQSGQIEIRVE